MGVPQNVFFFMKMDDLGGTPIVFPVSSNL